MVRLTSAILVPLLSLDGSVRGGLADDATRYNERRGQAEDLFPQRQSARSVRQRPKCQPTTPCSSQWAFSKCFEYEQMGGRAAIHPRASLGGVWSCRRPCLALFAEGTQPPDVSLRPMPHIRHDCAHIGCEGGSRRSGRKSLAGHRHFRQRSLCAIESHIPKRSTVVT